jgi:hypothetical protein
VPAGEFLVFWDGLFRLDRQASLARISTPFEIDVHEVTVAEAKAWVAAGMPAPCPPKRPCSLDPGGPVGDAGVRTTAAPFRQAPTPPATIACRSTA